MTEESNEVEQTNTPKSSEKVAVPPRKKNNKTLWIVLAIVGFFVIIPAILLTVGGILLKNKLDQPDAGEKLAESLIEKSTGDKVDINSKDGSFSAKTKDGDSFGIGGDQKLPDDFPKAVTAYLPEKKVVFVLTSNTDNKKNWSVNTSVDKSFEDAVSHFEGIIKSPDYSDTSNFGYGDAKTFYGIKDGKTVTITVSKDSSSGETLVGYIVSEE